MLYPTPRNVGKRQGNDDTWNAIIKVSINLSLYFLFGVKYEVQ